MASRTLSRLRALAGAAAASVRPRLKARPSEPKTILVLHELLLGDTLMLAPLLASLRARHPSATIYVAARREVLPLFSGRPYGVHALPFSERDPGGLRALAPARGCDLALIPGDNRYALQARALGAKWIVALEQPGSAWKNRLPDERVTLPERETALADIFALLAGATAQTLRYRPADWPAPAAAPFDRPAAPYAVLHVGASTPLKYWPAERWAALATSLAGRCQPVLSAGKKEAEIIRAIDPQGRWPAYPGTLDLAQLWHLLAGAERVVTLDTGVAHLAKLCGTPTVCLYGPGSSALVGRGEFWRDAPFAEITAPAFPCRDQRLLFKREIAWVRRCGRSLAQCPRPRCMEAISFEEVSEAAARAARTGARPAAR
jgi:ADP-heptose:LPS heptosyltransferase